MLLYYEVTIQMVRIMKGLFTTFPDAIVYISILQVHRLYQRALQKLPLCASLWKDVMLFIFYFILKFSYKFSACAISIDVVMLKIQLSLTSMLPCLLQQLLFEASEGGKTDNLRKLVSKCQEIGVSLNELLNLNRYKTESKNH